MTAIRRAKRQLEDAERRFETDCGPENTSQLNAEVKKAEERLALAQTRLFELRLD